MVVVQDGLEATVINLSNFEIKPDVVRRVPRALALRYDVLSLATDGNELTVALADPQNADILDRIKLATGMQVRAVPARAEDIRRHLSNILDSTEPLYREKRADEAPAIGVLDKIQCDAILAHASDLHIEPTRDGGRVRQRIDGILHEVCSLTTALFNSLSSRIKLLAGMDIADKRQPQDGRYSVDAIGRSIDARVSSMPTIDGEKLVIRLLDHQTRIPSLEHLGMPQSQLERYRRVVHAPHGFVVVCGPTGSGKTTTLYATLAERNLAAQSLCSVEDPVEIRITGVSQVQVNQRAGLTFASALRAFLRQDPNVIMVGEMRDAETANVAMSAALSGQLVLTTLHSTDAARTVDRLLELDVQRHSIAAALTAVVAQRLVRTLCFDCRVWQRVSDTNQAEFALAKDTYAYVATGCVKCSQSGYRGRTGIFELLYVDDRMRDAIASGAPSVTVATLAREAGYEGLLADGLRKALSGETSLDELRRVLALDLT